MFILVHHSTPNPCFRLRGYASSSHRLDIAARVIQASLCSAEGIRKDTRVYTYMADTGIILDFSWRNAACSEKELMGIIRRRLCGRQYSVFTPPTGLSMLLEEISPRKTILLTRNGIDLSSSPELFLEEPLAILLGGKEDIPENMLKGVSVERVSIGPLNYLASHAASFILSIIDSLKPPVVVDASL